MKVLQHVVLAIVMVPSAMFAQANAAGRQKPAVPPPVAAGAAGPSMEQTVAFLNEYLGCTGACVGSPIVHAENVNVIYSDVSITLDGPCTLVVKSTQQLVDAKNSRYSVDHLTTRVLLEKADPNTMRIDEYDGGTLIYVDQRTDGKNGTYSHAFLGEFANKSAAEHAAKAYIHAIALCYKPPLF